MEPSVLNHGLGVAGAVMALAISAVGSALGTCIAGSASVGAWKKCYALGKPAPFLLLSFVGAPLTQTLYGMILMFTIIGRVADKDASSASGFALMLLGIFAGIAIGASAWLQGKAAAASADAQAETGQGFTNYLAVLGIVETVAIFVMVFTLIAVGSV